MTSNNNETNLQVLVFLCNWSGFTEAAFMESTSLQCIPSIKIIRVMCSGSIKPAMVLEALNNGSDGVLICACKLGSCHYISGNEKAAERIEKVKQLLDILNIDTERVRLEYISPFERENFINIINSFNQTLLTLGM
ncbi:MAG: hydrogenase iron-sulfur subunit [Promethearchaeota archaeon]